MPGNKSLIALLGAFMVVSEIAVNASPTYMSNLSALTKSRRDVLFARRTAQGSRPSLVARAPKSGKEGKGLLEDILGLAGGVGPPAPQAPGGAPEAQAAKEGKGLLGDILGVTPGGVGQGLGADILSVPLPPGLGPHAPPPLEAAGGNAKENAAGEKGAPGVTSGQGAEAKEARSGAKSAPEVSRGQGVELEAKEAKSGARQPSVRQGKSGSRQLAGEAPAPPSPPELGLGKAGKGAKEAGGGEKIVRDAALALAQVSTRMDNTLQQMQSANATAADVKTGAVLGFKLGIAESFLRQLIARASQDQAAAQTSLGTIKDNTQLVTQGFDDIAKNSEDKGKVKASLEKIGAARKQVRQANNELVQGATTSTNTQSPDAKNNATKNNTVAADKQDQAVAQAKEEEKRKKEEGTKKKEEGTKKKEQQDQQKEQAGKKEPEAEQAEEEEEVDAEAADLAQAGSV